MRRIMYVENRGGGLDGDGRIGWVEVSRTEYRGGASTRTVGKTRESERRARSGLRR
jgi:hypothetical protein